MNEQYFLSIISWFKTKRKFVFTIITLYFFFLLINLPASVVISLVDLPSNVKVRGVSGSAWSGKIHELNISGVNLGSVSWKMQPAYLLLGA
ncbi:MAG: type II secretion system protein N, partial [Draconibacterium sp.]|nr:type II secretion system protein N [Draconibacterium sp.]